MRLMEDVHIVENRGSGIGDMLQAILLKLLASDQRPFYHNPIFNAWTYLKDVRCVTKTDTKYTRHAENL